jgi:hypothetical protein
MNTLRDGHITDQRKLKCYQTRQYCTMNGRLRRVASYKPSSGISSTPLSHIANQAPIG